MLVHHLSQNLGLDLGLEDLGSTLGGWTLLSLFLSRYGNDEQVQGYLSADVK